MQSIRAVHKAIWRKFGFRRDDTYPYVAAHGGREALADLFNELGYRRGVEIGVQRGLYSEILCKAIPGLQLTSVDPWKACPGISQRKQDRVRAEAYVRLPQYGVEIVEKPSAEAAKDIPDGSLDFVFIDGDHTYDGVTMDMIHYTPKVRIGGIVAGHDYLMAHNCDVIWAVDAYTRNHRIPHVYVTKDRCPTCFWVREPNQ